MTTPDVLREGRAAFDRSAWSEAFAQLAAADRITPLAPADLERWALAAHLIGKDEESTELQLRAHHERLDRGDTLGAAHVAFWIGFRLQGLGQLVQASGWFARAQRLLEESGADDVLRGYLLVPTAVRTIQGGDAAAAYPLFGQAMEIAQRFGDRQLIALARLGVARSHIRLGRPNQGIPLLDELMVAIAAREVPPQTVGVMYCSAIEACHEVFDVQRAQQWTAALTEWCAAQPDLVPYRGTCLVRRAELLQLHGHWSDALAESIRACERLSHPPGRPGAGGAYYQRAELHRLRGELDEAEACYEVATRHGRTAHPGLALLRMTQGRSQRAVAAICRCVEEARDDATRSTMLAACVDILLDAGDVTKARAAADQLAELAGRVPASYLRARAAYAGGAVCITEGRAADALDQLRTAWALWREIEAPYEGARARTLIALAHRGLGLEDDAAFELGAARAEFEALGAIPDVKRVDRLLATRAAREDAPLTARERQVIELIARGKTNRAIATALGISEKTAARHVANIFLKLGLSTRAAVASYAYEHKLV